LTGVSGFDVAPTTTVYRMKVNLLVIG